MKHGVFLLVVWSMSTTLLSAGCNTEPPEQTVFDDQLETLDRARAVEEQLGERATRIEQQIDEANEPKDPQ